MTSVPSTMLKLGTKLPPFELPDYEGNTVSSDEFEGDPVLVIFMCNHCPYVKNIVEKLSERTKEYRENGVHVVGISSNNVEEYPDDSPEKMKQFAEKHDLDFPYLYDESQEVAKAYRAACTPDIYLFNPDHELVYRGQFDDSRPGNGVEPTGADLTAAVNKMLAGEGIPEEQAPSVGCNIKWKPGNAPEYFG
ncbi:MAG: thioredoxin family protein [Candidatus Marinimicrobia bacterium]|nr:thioredoxin family protein [Candidatus Neomarinimicrobiota bacterium]MCF7827750.1 thioredoxin family protein [Candidatus Neomarinimicrobiota bacterium]MCF7881450.1 thioredoxin family protein [Candidatus Neomarinimicrobiota bacterium]